MKRLILALSFLGVASSANAQSPAARVNDATSHGGNIVGPGAPTVFIAGLPAAALGDFATCPQTPPSEPPHVGGPILTGSSTVFVGGRPLARVGDTVAETGATATILTGAITVTIGP